MRWRSNCLSLGELRTLSAASGRRQAFLFRWPSLTTDVPLHIDTGFRKCNRYKHVQSANIGVKCVTFVSETFTRYGSNVANVWQEIFAPMTLAYSCEVVHEKL